MATKIWAKQESGLTTVQLKQDPPVPVEELGSTLDESLSLDATTFNDASKTTYTIKESSSNHGKYKLLTTRNIVTARRKPMVKSHSGTAQSATRWCTVLT